MTKIVEQGNRFGRRKKEEVEAHFGHTRLVKSVKYPGCAKWAAGYASLELRALTGLCKWTRELSRREWYEENKLHILLEIILLESITGKPRQRNLWFLIRNWVYEFI